MFSEEQDDGKNDRPCLFIPSYPPPTPPPPNSEDNGQVRPVPSPVAFYLCPGIQPLTVFSPGSDLTVQVTIMNWGGGNSETGAQVAVWWSPPVSGKPVLDKKHPNGPVLDKDHLIGFSSVPVPPHGGHTTTPPMIHHIPANAGSHICLFARVWHADDMPETNDVDPINDRHWTQRNLFVVGSDRRRVRFWVTNVSNDSARFRLRVQPIGQRIWPQLREMEHDEPVRSLAKFRLAELGRDEETVGEDSIEHWTALDAGEVREVRLSIELAEPLESGTFAPFEVLQYREGAVVGGLGIAVRAAH